jgi:flavin-binding protein dodecin
LQPEGQVLTSPTTEAAPSIQTPGKEKDDMSVYKIIEIVGTSENSWEEAAKNAVETASKSLKDLRVAEVTKCDLKIEDGKVKAYRARVSVSFKYQPS